MQYRVAVIHRRTCWYDVEADTPEEAIEEAIHDTSDGICTSLAEFESAEVESCVIVPRISTAMKVD